MRVMPPLLPSWIRYFFCCDQHERAKCILKENTMQTLHCAQLLAILASVEDVLRACLPPHPSFLPLLVLLSSLLSPFFSSSALIVLILVTVLDKKDDTDSATRR